MHPIIEEALNTFIEEIEVLAEQYGVEPVEAALQELLPDFDPVDFEDHVDPEYRHDLAAALSEGVFKSVAKLGGKLKNFVRGKWGGKAGKGGKAGAAAAGAGGAAAGLAGGGIAGGLGTWMGKGWDQDVDIAAVSTEDTLNVKSPNIEKLLAQNSEAIAKMIQVLTQTQQELSKKLSDLDKSVDYMASGEDESPDQVNIRQDLGLSKTKSKKSGDKEAEKKAKEIKSGRADPAMPVKPPTRVTS